MLTELATVDELADDLLEPQAWQLWPDIDDRERWDAVSSARREAYLQQGVAALELPWPRLPATLYLQFARNGDRTRFQTPNSQRRQMLLSWVIAECLENQGRFVDPIVDALWGLCEESSWCLPAHIGVQRAGLSLPDVAEPILDLFAGETGALVAWTGALLGRRLEAVSPVVGRRLHDEVQSRVLTPFLTRDDLGWMGFGEAHRLNNWNPWINSNVLTCALLIEQDRVRRAAIVHKSMRSVDRFLGQYPADGGCDEGPGYWGRAGASVFECLELLSAATAGRLDAFGEPLIGEMGRFIYRTHIAGPWFVNFADASARPSPDGALIRDYGQRIGDLAMVAFGDWLLGQQSPSVGTSAPRALRRVFTLSPPAAAAPPLPREVWLPEIEVMVCRTAAGSADGLTVAAKGGHNAESHNHNDIGHFVVYVDGLPTIIDVGVESYRRQTFSPDRYQIWTMQSQYHSLPTVNGVMQAAGRDYQAREAAFAATDDGVSFELELAGAYPATAGIVSWRRRLIYQRPRRLELIDSYRLNGPAEDLFLSLMTPCRVAVGNGQAKLSAAALPGDLRSGELAIHFDPTALVLTVEELPIEDTNLLHIWGAQIRRLSFRPQQPTAEGQLKLAFTP